MKTYFTNLFNYDCYANGVMLQAINDSRTPQNAARLMAHLLAAQQIWLNRCLSLPLANVELWPAYVETGMDLSAGIKESHAAWMKLLNSTPEADFDKVIQYHNLQGISFSNKLVDILAHVVNHGTHHRAQIGQRLKSAGAAALPLTDYITYVRQINN